jgi:hypothetical protein
MAQTMKSDRNGMKSQLQYEKRCTPPGVCCVFRTEMQVVYAVGHQGDTWSTPGRHRATPYGARPANYGTGLARRRSRVDGNPLAGTRRHRATPSDIWLRHAAPTNIGSAPGRHLVEARRHQARSTLHHPGITKDVKTVPGDQIRPKTTEITYLVRKTLHTPRGVLRFSY